MDPTQPLLAAFELRLQQPGLPDGPANIADFIHPAAARATAEGLDIHGDDQLLLESASLSTPDPQRSGERLVPLFEASVWQIPLPEMGTGTISTPIDPGPWDIRESSPALAARVGRRSADPLRAIVIAAVTIPLLLTSAPALASAAPEVQRPTAAPQGSPAQTPIEPAQPSPETAPPAVEPAQPPQPLSEPSEPAQPAQPAAEDTPSSDPEPTAMDVAAPSDGGRVTEQEWQAMQGLEVKLMLAQGPRVGRLASADGASIVFIDNLSGGKLYTIPKSEVMELRGVVSNTRSNGRPQGVPDPNLPSGAGLIAGGIVAAAIGTPFFLSGVGIGIGCGPSCTSLSVPLALAGVLGLGAGIPMIVFGSRRRKAYKKSMFETVRLTPSVGGTRQAWTGSLTLQF